MVGILGHQAPKALPVLMEDPHLATLVLQGSRPTMAHPALVRDLKWCLYLREDKALDPLDHQAGQKDQLGLHKTNQRL